jgi:hypothetical protein
MKYPLQHFIYAVLLAALSTPYAVLAQAKAAPPIDGIIGKLQSFDGKSLDVATKSGAVHVVVMETSHNLQTGTLRFESHHRIILCWGCID